jgi:plasmid replication initiation protein
MSDARSIEELSDGALEELRRSKPHGKAEKNAALAAWGKKRSAEEKRTRYIAGDPERDLKERWVTMHNALARAGHGLTLSEKRVIALAISSLDSATTPPNVAAPPRTKITAADYAEVFGVSADAAYEQLQGAAKHLFERKLTFYDAANKRGGKSLEPTKKVMRWVGQADYHKGEGWVELYWWPALIGALMGLKKNFTSYQLKQTTALRSVYSWRLLELLTRFKQTGWAQFDIEDFLVSMDAPPSLSDFAQVKRRIIIPAVTELVVKDGWSISWLPIKTGRKVTAIRFEFTRNDQQLSLL